MPTKLGTFFTGSVTLVLLAASAMSADKHQLNGTWTLEPTKSDFAGQSTIQTGTVTIEDRQHNISVQRNFTYDGASQSFQYSFSTDGRENSTIKQGKRFRSKAKWDGDVLQVTTTDDAGTTIERYSLEPGGEMRLVVHRPGHEAITLFFQRQ